MMENLETHDEGKHVAFVAALSSIMVMLTGNKLTTLITDSFAPAPGFYPNFSERFQC